MLSSIPLITAILGILMLFLVLGKGEVLRKHKSARTILAVIILMAVHAQVDAWLYFNDLGSDTWGGLSFIHYHLMGGLFLYFTHLLFKIDIRLRLWLSVLAAYTVIRVLILLPLESSAYENYSENLDWTDLGIALDFLISNTVNIVALWVAFVKVRGLPFSVELSNQERINYLWLKNLLLVQMVIYIAVIGNALLTFYFPDQWLTFWKVESMLQGFFFFVLAFFAIRFPVFSVYGDFQDLAPTEKKYAKSSLTEDISVKIWEALKQLMIEEKPYINPEYRLNDLAVRLDKSVHHVSQVINENEGTSFSEFVNGYRVAEAKRLLSSEKAKKVTILAIALEAGFNSKTAFYNTFKKLTGKTPTQFIREQNTD